MKKIILLFLFASLTVLVACSDPVVNNEFMLTQFESQVSVDRDLLNGRLIYASPEEITLTVDYPEEIKGLEFKQNTFGITVSFEETQINEFQSELFGFNLSPVEELFEYLSTLGENNFTVDGSGNFKAETVFDEIKGKFDLKEKHIISIESENHKFEFTVN